MKILQVHNFYRTPGGECSVVRAERTLLESNGHVVIPYYRDSREIDGWGALRKARMLIDIPYSRRVERDIVAVIHACRPDVAHVHNVFPLLTPAVYRAIRSSGVPVVQTVHNFRFLCPNGQFFVDDRVCELCQERGYTSAVWNRCMQDSVLVSAAYATAIARSWKTGILPFGIDSFIVLNNFFAERLVAAGVPQERIRLLPNYVSECVKNVPPKGQYMLYLGRLSREKGIRTLLEAWRQIDDVPLKIAGSGPLLDEVRRMANELGGGRIEVLGHVHGDAKHELLKGALGAIVPSEWYENFPVSVVEAMAHGTPVLASHIGGLPELVADSATGLLFQPGDVESLVNATRRFLSEPGLRERLADGALAKAHALYGPVTHYHGLMAIYGQLANAGQEMVPASHRAAERIIDHKEEVNTRGP